MNPAARRLTALLLAPVVLLPGCIATGLVERTARGDPAGDVAVQLLVQGDRYVLEHWPAADDASARQGYPPRLTLARTALPAGCPAARFGHAGPDGWTALAPGTVRLIPAGPAPPAPACGVTVARDDAGHLVVTGPGGELARDVPAPPRPAAWALAPVAVVVDTWVFLVAAVTSPVWGPAAIGWNHVRGKRDQARDADLVATLPVAVAACRDALRATATATDPVRRFDWLPVPPATYQADDAVVTLAGAQLGVAFQADRWTDASGHCDLASGTVTASRLQLRD
jgi:hypothetical protein